MLDESFKDFIVNPTDIPWKWVKRLATSGKMAIHGSWVKMYNLCRVLKNIITAMLTVTSYLENSQNNGKLME